MLSLHCCSRAFSHCSGFCCCRSQALGTRASVIMAHGPSCSVAYGVLVPRLGIEPVSPALAGGLNHWTTREVPLISAPRWDSHCALLHSAGWLPYISLLFSNWHPLSRWPGFLLHRENWNHQNFTRCPPLPHWRLTTSVAAGPVSTKNGPCFCFCLTPPPDPSCPFRDLVSAALLSLLKHQFLLSSRWFSLAIMAWTCFCVHL